MAARLSGSNAFFGAALASRLLEPPFKLEVRSVLWSKTAKRRLTRYGQMLRLSLSAQLCSNLAGRTLFPSPGKSQSAKQNKRNINYQTKPNGKKGLEVAYQKKMHTIDGGLDNYLWKSDLKTSPAITHCVN